MALVVLSLVEQRLDAVRAVLAGASVVEIAAEIGVSRSTLHRWVGRYLSERLPGLVDRSHRPHSSPRQVPAAVEAAIAEMRRTHPRWGSRRIWMELQRRPHPEVVMVPAERTIDRILIRQGLARERPHRRAKPTYRRWERPGPMQLWQVDIVEGLQLVDTGTGELRGVKLVTGVDDHSRFCVIAKVVERATARVVCLAFAEALTRYGVPEEVITDNGKQFTDRFGRRGEVLFDKICRRNGITHRLTAPASPNQNGKVERFHGTLRPDFLDAAEPFTSLAEAQAAVDAWVGEYNTDRPHQGLNEKAPVVPADRFAPVPDAERAVVQLWLPTALADLPQPLEGALPSKTTPSPLPAARPLPGTPWHGGPVEFDRVVPASGNMVLARRQIWLGPSRAGQLVRFWADCDLIHLLIDGTRIKTLRSHLSVTDLARLAAHGAVAAGPSPLPAIEDADALEVERTVNGAGLVSLAGRKVLAAEILAGRHVGIRIEATTLMFFDLDSRELLRTRPNPIPAGDLKGLRGVRRAGPPPRPATEPVRVQRRASATGVIMIAGQKVALGRHHAHQTVTVTVSETTLAIELPDGDVHVARRTTELPIRNIKADRPRTVTYVS